MPRVPKIIYTCGECAAQGVENHGEGFDIVIRNSETGEVVVSSTWEGCVAHRDALDAFVASVRAYGTRMRNYTFSMSDTPVLNNRDRGYGGPQPSTRGITSNSRPAARAIGASNGRTTARPKPPALAPPPSPPPASKPLEELSREELGQRLVAPAPPAAFKPPAASEPPTPPAPNHVPPAPTPASTGVTSPADPEGPLRTGLHGNKAVYKGRPAIVKNGKIVMESVMVSCLNHDEPKSVAWRARGSHMITYHGGANYWSVSWQYDNLPDGWPLYECGYIVDEKKNDICLLEFPNKKGLEGHRRNTKHQKPED